MVAVGATLIQSIAEFRAALQPRLQPLVEKYAYEGAVFEDALRYVVAEEIEIVYGLYDEHHCNHRRIAPYPNIYCELRNSFAGLLSRLVAHYVAAPRLYAPYSEVRIRLQVQDLVIDYYRDPLAAAPEVYYEAQLAAQLVSWLPAFSAPSRVANYSQLVE